MEPHSSVAEDLRAHALRRTIRFSTACLLVAAAIVGSQLAGNRVNSQEIFLGIATLLTLLAAVEAFAGFAVLHTAKARPKTSRISSFTNGPIPSWLAAALFLAVAGLIAFVG